MHKNPFQSWFSSLNTPNTRLLLKRHEEVFKTATIFSSGYPFGLACSEEKIRIGLIFCRQYQEPIPKAAEMIWYENLRPISKILGFDMITHAEADPRSHYWSKSRIWAAFGWIWGRGYCQNCEISRIGVWIGGFEGCLHAVGAFEIWKERRRWWGYWSVCVYIYDEDEDEGLEEVVSATKSNHSRTCYESHTVMFKWKIHVSVIPGSPFYNL